MTKYQLKCSILAAIAWIAFCFCWNGVTYGQDANKSAQTRLRIVGFFPAHNSTIWPGGFHCIPGALLAVEEINSANLLPGYELDFEYLDSACGRQDAVMGYLKEIASKATPPVAIIGPGCSEAALALASFTAQPGREALMVSYGASTPTLSNLVAFPYFLRTVQSQTFMGKSMASFVTHFKWKSIAIVYEDGLIQRSTVLTFRASLDGDIDLSSTHRLSIPNDRVTEQTEDLLARTLEQIKHRRIIFVLVHPAVGRCLMLQAARQNMVYPSYVWIFPQLLDQWWDLKCLENETNRACSANNDTANSDTANNDTSCEYEQKLINRAVNGAFHFSYKLDQSPDFPMIASGLSISQYSRMLTNRARKFVAAYNQENNANVSYKQTDHASAAYDAVWAVALGLEVTEQKLQSVNLSLADHAENFEYISKVLHNSILNNVSFIGASGNISFNSHGTVESPVDVTQLQSENGTEGLNREDIGVFFANSAIDPINKSALYWIKLDESQPTDEFPPTYITVTTANVVVVLLLTVLTFIANCILIFVNYYFRNEKGVKATSPSLNNFIFSGHFCIIMYVVAFSIVSSVPHLEQVYYGILCNLLPWTLAVGYSLLNGTIFWKTWRLYKVFSAKIELKQAWLMKLKDGYLISGIAATVVVSDIVPLILFTAFTPLHKSLLKHGTNDELMEITVPVCALNFRSDAELLPFALILVCKSLLMAFVVFSAFMLLKANIPERMDLFNDSGVVFTFSLVQFVLGIVSFALVLFYPSTDNNYRIRLHVVYSVLTLGPLLVVGVSLCSFGCKYRGVAKSLWKQLRNSCCSKQTVEDAEWVYQSSARQSLQQVTWTSMYSMQALYSPRFPRHSRISRSSNSSVSSSYTSSHGSNATSLTSISSAL